MLQRLYLRFLVRNLVLDIRDLAVSVHCLLLQLLLFLLCIGYALSELIYLIVRRRKHRLLLRDSLLRLFAVNLKSGSLCVKLVQALLFRDD